MNKLQEQFDKLQERVETWLNSLAAETKPQSRKPQAADTMDKDLTRWLVDAMPNTPAEAVLNYFNGMPSEAARMAVISTLQTMHRENYWAGEKCKPNLPGNIIATLNAFDTRESLLTMAEISKSNLHDGVHVASLLCASDNPNAAIAFDTVTRARSWTAEDINMFIDILARNPGFHTAQMLTYCLDLEFYKPLQVKTKILETILDICDGFSIENNKKILGGFQDIIRTAFESAAASDMIGSARTNNPAGKRLIAVFDRIAQTPYIAQDMRDEAVKARWIVDQEQQEAEAIALSWLKEAPGLISPQQSPR